MKQRVCRDCREPFEPVRAMQPRCIPCAIIKGRQKTQKDAARVAREARKATRTRLMELKPKSYWRGRAQSAANALARARDAGLPCISCGRFHQGQWHGGHYLSRGAHPELALEIRNIHKQCQPCNTSLSGNQLKFRDGLISRYGEAEVRWLEGPHEAKHYTIDDLKAIEKTYKAKLKELTSLRAGQQSAD